MFSKSPVSTSKSLEKASEKASTTSQNTSVRFYLDFDGTLSKQPGAITVASAFYRSLQVGRSAFNDYATAKFIPEKEMTQKITAEFKRNETSAMRLSFYAKEFLEKTLDNNAEIIIISKNRREYIQAILQAEGLSKTHVDKIKIHDVNDLPPSRNPKYDMVMQCENEHNKASRVLVCDDDEKDHQGMINALSKRGYKDEVIMSYRHPAGQFNWEHICRDTLAKVGLISMRPDTDNGDTAQHSYNHRL